MKCLECGHDLEEMRRELIGFTVDNNANPNLPWELWKYSYTVYAGHCKNCLRDWEWSEKFENGKFSTEGPERIFWG